MESLDTLIDNIDFAKIYVFGSAIFGINQANDLDVLIVYNNTKCTPQEARLLASEIVNVMERYFKKRIHLVLLSNVEEESIRFIEAENCERLEDWLSK